MTTTFLDIVKNCDNFPYPNEKIDEENLMLSTVPLLLNNVKIGLIPKTTISALKKYNEQHKKPCPFIIEDTFVTFASHLNTFEERTQIIKNLLITWREEKTFPALEGWRDELYPVYGPSNDIAFVIERSATPLFGVLTFGVHLSAYIRTPEGKLKMWIAKRSKTKPKWPGYLDNTVAGGIPYMLSTSETVVKEAMEEASLPAEIAEKAVPVGAITCFIVTKNGLQPEAEYVYDLELPIDVIPKPLDGEVECFYLWDIDEVKNHILANEFKPNCALVIIDFMIRHSIIKPENEPSYLEILSRLHRRFEFPAPTF
ncbi:30543_t:CDS:2 [Gigaspora margarita]|uniref:30543_t:CDS:1 n=1 Tax=Gigaspora margarita TaxID=4874 RepID=A0ABN7WS95_GIGMA|nr:30543_t:CDS:2 [Gigaspora margarita]